MYAVGLMIEQLSKNIQSETEFMKLSALIIIVITVLWVGEQMAVTKKLKHYATKRNFKKTPEPTGSKIQKIEGPIFVIQEHDATALHYDFRIEMDGVLKSWAIPKGISTNPGKKHLAIPTEDHPMDYAYFEGEIPAGNYGAGTVMVWDIGTYENLKEERHLSMEECYKKGRIELFLHGKKLHGGYALIKTGSGDSTRWLFLKMRDEYADKPIKGKTKSALTGRTMKQIGVIKKRQKKA